MDGTHNGLPVAGARQTSLGLYATTREAYDRWRADPHGVRILDVRGPEEYVLVGHAPVRTLPTAPDTCRREHERSRSPVAGALQP